MADTTRDPSGCAAPGGRWSAPRARWCPSSGHARYAAAPRRPPRPRWAGPGPRRAAQRCAGRSPRPPVPPGCPRAGRSHHEPSPRRRTAAPQRLPRPTRIAAHARSRRRLPARPAASADAAGMARGRSAPWNPGRSGGGPPRGRQAAPAGSASRPRVGRRPRTGRRWRATAARRPRARCRPGRRRPGRRGAPGARPDHGPRCQAGCPSRAAQGRGRHQRREPRRGPHR